MHRRQLLQYVSSAGIWMATAEDGKPSQDDEGESPRPAPADFIPDPKHAADRERVLAAGMTEQEANCWELAAKLAGGMFALPDPHPMDNHEISHAIHVIQNKLLARPTYREYLKLAKEQQRAKASDEPEEPQKQTDR